MLENINTYDELIEHLNKKSAEFVPCSTTIEDLAKRWGVKLKRKNDGSKRLGAHTPGKRDSC